MKTIYRELQTVIASESTGLDKTIKLCESYLQNLFEHPLNHQIMRHYLVAVSNADIDPEESLRKLVSEEEQDSSEKMRARYLREVITSEKIWKDAIEHGFEDGSIRDDLNANQLVHFLHMIISGIVDRVNLERIPLQKVSLSVERIIKRTIELICNDLAKKGIGLLF